MTVKVEFGVAVVDYMGHQVDIGMEVVVYIEIVDGLLFGL